MTGSPSSGLFSSTPPHVVRDDHVDISPSDLIRVPRVAPRPQTQNSAWRVSNSPGVRETRDHGAVCFVKVIPVITVHAVPEVLVAVRGDI